MGAKQVPNFVWGAIGRESFQLSIEDLQNFPNEFLAEGFYNKERYLKEFIPENKVAMFAIIDTMRKCNHNIYKDSPFQISLEIEMLSKDQFSSQDEFILKKLKDANCYCVVKIGDQIVFMTGGQLDNSIGYIFSSKKPTNESLGCLFSLALIEDAGDNLYFYVSR
jgi:hypothetical protein